MSNCNFPICLSPTEENSEDANKTKQLPREKPLKVSYKNKMKAKRALIKPGEVATVIDLQTENKENVNPFHGAENQGVGKQQEVMKKIDSKKSGDVRVDKNKTVLSDSDASTKEGKITRKNVLKSRNDSETLKNIPSRSDLDDIKVLKDLGRNKNKKETDGGNVNVEKDKNQKVAENKVNECEKQRKENVRRKVKGKVVKNRRDSDDLFKINISTSRKDLSFMNNEPLHRNETSVKENCSKIEVKKEEKDVITDEEKCGESQATEIEEEDASKEECRGRRKNDAVIIDGVEILEVSDSVNLVENPQQRKDDSKIDEQLGKNECEEDGQRKDKSMPLVSSDCIEEFVGNEDGQQSRKENRISYVENKQFGNTGEDKRNADKSPKNKQQSMLEEVVASKDGVGDGPECLNKDREHDNLEKENEGAKEDDSKPPDSPIPQESNRRKNRNEDGERPNLEKQECERKKLTRKKTSSLSNSSIINNKLSPIHNKCPAGKGD
ncbi:uncharacterized protein PF11_0213, partial [Nilaparvata lugens]|uniref:uncharacterized protein PF11_0213 n=1 Tax=Nilaparvata lugens TaxID=108931 RepID=UPI00193D1C71